MADSLILKGVKSVRKHKGSEMQLAIPKGGGDTHSLKEWWKNGVSKCYVSCTVFNVTTATGTVKLALDTNPGTDIRIDHDGSFNFSFFGINEVRRAALFNENYELIEHYLFPAISRGKIVTATTAGAAPRPSSGGPALKFIGNVVIDGGDEIITEGEESHLINASITGTANVTWQWVQASGSGTIVFSDANAASTKITADAAGSYQVTATASSSDSDLTGASSKSMNYLIEVQAGTGGASSGDGGGSSY